uniref:Uncharacterized protein n=2 Tax=Sphaerodactylus townsendi TaxID=933632 RepID=A0ACB8EE59_9SAUR
MNSPMAVLTLFLVAAFLLSTEAQPGQNGFCCYEYVKKPTPLRLLSSYEVTSRCSLPAVVFFTKRNNKICADPKEPWTQERMKNLPENGRERNP